MKFKLWPENVKYTDKKSYDKSTGKRRIKKGVITPSSVRCPKCYKVLEYAEFGDRYDGIYCFKCGRDLRKPFTKVETFKYWAKWMGDWKILGEWPIGYLYEESD